MSSVAAEAEPSAGRLTRLRALPGALALPVGDARAVATVGIGLIVAASAFAAQGGSRLEPTTWTEVGLMALGAVAVAAAALWARPARGLGSWTVAAFAALTAFTALSITWSLAPANSWEEANRTFAYLAVLAGAVALVRLRPALWPSILGGVALGAVIVCSWSLLTKVFPGALAEGETFARLRPPFQYWNSVGLMAALGVPPLLWLAARRSGHLALNALAWPGLGLLLVCLLLSYSRGALLAVGVGVAFWFAVTPLRLRGLAALGGAIACAAPVIAWTFGQDGLSVDDAPLTARIDAGHGFGALLLLLMAVLAIAGLLTGFATAQHPPTRIVRRRAGAAVLGVLALVPLAAIIALAASPGGVSGHVSRSWQQLTDPNVGTPGNTPGRLTATSSVRARYWDEALHVHSVSPWLGTGAGAFDTVRTRFRTKPLAVRHAHGYVVQTLADLGWAGLALSLLVLACWAAAAARAVGLSRRGWRGPADAERVGLLTMVAVVVVFGVHSTVDWTWFVPGNVVPALLCAGWVAGRGATPTADAAAGGGPVAEVPATAEDAPTVTAAEAPDAGAAAARRPAGPRWRPPPERAALAAVPLLIALAAAWAALQPVRAAHAEDAAFARAAIGAYRPAVSIAEIAHERNPLSVDPLFVLAAMNQAAGRLDPAQRALEQAVQLEPANADTWRRLGHFMLDVRHDPRRALDDFRAALYLDPQSTGSQSDVVAATRALHPG